MKPLALRPVWIGRIALVGYAVLLALLAQDFGIETPLPSLSRLHTEEAMALLGRLAMALSMRALVFVPLGFLAALALGARERWVDRLVRLWIPAVVGSVALAAGLIAIDRGFVSPLDLVLPTLGCAFGVAMGVAWTKGPKARRLFLPQLAVALLLLVAGFGVIATSTLEWAPLPFERTQVSSGEKRLVYRQFQGKSPQTIPEGKTEEVTLTARDLNVLLAWGLSLGQPSRKALVELDQDHANLSLSFTLPGGTRYLNMVLGASGRVEDGRLQFRAEQLSVGRLEAPSWLLHLLSPAVARAIGADQRVRPLLKPIRSLAADRDALRIVYGHGELPNGFVADLFRGEGTGSEDLPVVRAQVRHLLDLAGSLPRGEARLGATVEAAFDYARLRSKEGNAAQENRGAVLALGILVGHWRVQNLVGAVLDEGRLKLATRAFKGSTLRGRDDWPKHFFVSASLTLVSREKVSDAVGILKEELDADGGSGFSFGDLMADRAGTTFALAATRDDASARAMQARLDRGFKVDDFFPPAADLPEDLTDAEFQARFGGVGGAGYNRLVEEIEKRLGRCAAYEGIRAGSGSGAGS
jgi:hypothetical protein